MPKVMNMYNGLFHQYINEWSKPDLYIILDLTWDDFVKRIFDRGRESEIANYDANKDYFKALHSNYVDLMIAQCVIYDIPYRVFDTSALNADDVYALVSTRVDEFIAEKGLV